jgi:transcriptional regulator with XRE-family HTH domain
VSPERSASDLGVVLREARQEAGISLGRMARLTAYSKSYLGNIETGRRPVTVDIIAVYERELGPIGDDMLRRRDITHPRTLKADKPTLTQLARSIDSGDPSALANTPTSRSIDFFLAAKLSPTGTDHVREWVRTGRTSTLRANALAVISKMGRESDTPLIIECLENDDQVRFLSLASEVSKLMQWDWETSKRVAKQPHTAPQPRKLAKALTKEALLDTDAESRWCGAHLLKELVPVLGR